MRLSSLSDTLLAKLPTPLETPKLKHTRVFLGISAHEFLTARSMLLLVFIRLIQLRCSPPALSGICLFFFFCIADDQTPLCSPHFTYFFFSSKLSFHSPLSFLCRWRRAGEAEGRTRRRHLANSEVHPVDGEVKAQEILVVCPRGDKANVRGWRRHVISKIRSWLLFKRSPFTNPA